MKGVIYLSILSSYNQTIKTLSHSEFYSYQIAFTLFKWGMGTSMSGVLTMTEYKATGVFLLMYCLFKLLIGFLMVVEAQLEPYSENYQKQFLGFELGGSLAIVGVSIALFILSPEQVTLGSILLACALVWYNYKKYRDGK